jgi:two-component system LytT family response regulator
MIKCVIIDDEQPAINVLENYIKRIPYLQLVGTATNPVVGVKLIDSTKSELVFLDIQMDEMSGIEVMKILAPEVKVIFCTAYSEFAITSYELNAVDYLMKPIPFDRFTKAIIKIKPVNNTSLINEAEGISNDYIFVKTEQKGKMVKIDLDDIDFIEAMNNYIAFYRGTSKILVYSSMKEIEGHLPGSKFMRIHKSYIIAISKIASVDNNCIILKNRSEQIPISNTYKTAFMQMLTNNVLNGN